MRSATSPRRRPGRPLRLALVTALLTLVLTTAAVPGGAMPSAASSPAVPGDAFATIAANPELTVDHATVFRLYWAFFGRQPDAGGALYWIGQRDSCVGVDVIAGYFARSEEFALRYGPLDDRAFVELIYRNVLGRPGDAEGVAYWTGLVSSGQLDRGGVVLYVSLSPEFRGAHPYPSDGVAARACQLPDGRSAGRSVSVVDGRPLLAVGGLTLLAPTSVIERAGFHQSSHPGALVLDPVDPAPARLSTLPSRGRGTDARTAIDIVTDSRAVITAPVSGTVLRAENYRLYCKYPDSYVAIRPDGRPDLELKILHITGLQVRSGQRIEAGAPVADHPTTFPFRSQVDRYTAEPSWPHVHIEVVDPSVPRRSTGSC